MAAQRQAKKSDDEVGIQSPSLDDRIHFKSARSERPAGLVRRRYIVFLVTGNPGLVEYYREFLRLLYKDLGQRNTELGYDLEVYGRSMSGFEVGNLGNHNGRRRRLLRHPRTKQRALGLQQQIEAVEQDLFNVANASPMKESTEESGSSSAKEIGEDDEPFIILIGHSVGGYIIMDLIQRSRRRLGDLGGGQRESADVRQNRREPRIVAGICLFPTVVDIAISTRGQNFTPLSRLPAFPQLVALACKSLTVLTPSFLLRWLVKRLTRFGDRATAITITFLSSTYGVKSSMEMARDEMNAIKTDQWDSEVWGAAEPSVTGRPRPKLFFFFGRQDHWVADNTREALIKCRGGSEEWQPRMEIDEDGLPHGFCIAHAEPVAAKCARYVEEVVQLLSKA